MNLVIVESPTKSKTISKFLGKDFTVEASYGHIRDLPKGQMGIDAENDFAPRYVIPTRCRKRANELKKLAAKADLIYFATDEDREGEAISWHLAQIIQPDEGKIKRIAFHEITKEAVLEALKNPRQIDLNLVDAQQARRILDRLVGYELSPFLWHKVARGLSAGRVQSVALRFIAEREREIKNFTSEEYWTIGGSFETAQLPPEQISAELAKINGEKIKQTVKYDLFAGEYSASKTSVLSQSRAEEISEELKKSKFHVAGVDKKEIKKNPPAPFTTSTLQQDAGRKLGFSSKQTMMLAQQLYEGIKLGKGGNIGLITYMRTDSVILSDKFLGEAAACIEKTFGKDYLKTRQYKTRSKMAQEAHEAIRPTEAGRAPESVEQYLDHRQFKLYSLIWRRALSSQMSPSVMDSTSVSIASADGGYSFQTSGSVVKFDGYLKIYGGKSEETILPELIDGEILNLKSAEPQRHFTSPPPRYSEAMLIKTLEKFSIGRPSTYAPTLGTIRERGYVEKDENKKFYPQEIGLLVNDLLVKHFPRIVDVVFTAEMENKLDEVARGEKKWVPVIRDFYRPFKENLMQKEEELSKKEIAEEKTDAVCEKCGQPMVVKIGRFGKFLACTGFPACRNTKQLEKDGSLAAPETTDEKCEKCGAPMAIKRGRFGKFLGCSNYPDCKNIKSLAKSTGVKCPSCGTGDIVEKRSKRGRNFYACNRWPDCSFALWQKPTGEKCPDCGALLVFAAGDQIKCSSKECKFSKDSEAEKS